MQYKKTQLTRSLAAAFAVAALTLGAGHSAMAQSTASGSVFGEVQASSGSQILIESAATGFKRTVGVADGGRFYISSLLPGHYSVQLLKDGKSVSTVEVDVVAGQGAEAFFGAVTKLDTVQVVGRARTIDVSNTANVSTFSAKQLANLPIASKDLNGIIALAANTTAADPRYAGGVSIGGGAPSENSYYVDGFAVTNALTQLGSIELPFGAIQSAGVQTGGFGAEFGRSVGGVVNISTKSGTNKWEGGVQVTYDPNKLTSKRKDLYYANTGSNPDTDNSIYRYRKGDHYNDYTYSAYVGGPLIQDKLFVFLAASQDIAKSGVVSAEPLSSALGSQGWTDQKDTNTRYFAKVDWLLTEDHRLQFTVLGDNYKSNIGYSGYSYDTHSATAATLSETAKNLANVTPAVGGEAQIIHYVGNLTDDLTVNVMYGQSSSKHGQSYNGDISQPEVSWAPGVPGQNPNLTYPTTPPNPLLGGTTLIGAGAKDTTKSLRADVEYKLGIHLLRAGLDENRLKSVGAGETVAGGSWWAYNSTTDPTFTGLGTIPIGQLTQPVNGRYYYVRQYIFDDATGAQSNQSAQYLEDRIQATRNWLITAGLRNESFVNKNGDGQTFLKSKNFVSPRLSSSWDVNGDASLKIFGSAGRYSLQIPTHVAVRGASRSTYTYQYFAYTGVDPTTGLPTGLTSNGIPYSTNNEYGQAKDVNTVAAQDLKPTYQDEISLGIEKALMPGVKGSIVGTYRTLKATIDDLCDARPFIAYAAANNINTDNWGGFGCASFNPGMANTFLVDYSGTGTNYTKVNLSAADLGFDKAKRTYTALDFSLEHPFSNGWFGKVTYTWSRSKGNTEGQTKSDNAQTDVAATSTWDNPELMQGAYGLLPNDRTHQIKAMGYYQLTPEWMLGANFKFESGRPRSCFGNRPGTDPSVDYGNVYFYCDGVAVPRGTAGRTPSTTTLDMNAAYKPVWGKGLLLRVDVFNVFNRQTPVLYDETREVSQDASTIEPTYGRVMSYTAPRSVRFTAQYDF